MKNNKEIRLADVRFEETEGKMILEGYAIVFEQETLIGDEERGFKEVISRTALTDAFMKDVPLKYNHMDSFLILARTKNKSLVLILLYSSIELASFKTFDKQETIIYIEFSSDQQFTLPTNEKRLKKNLKLFSDAKTNDLEL